MSSSAGQHAPPYAHVAWVYDLLASGYSLGAIDRAKAFHHGLVSDCDRVLYAGAGAGREVLGVLQRGAEVTCVEPCPVMVERLHNRLAKHGERFVIVPRPIQAVPVEQDYDLVVAHFFLNVFSADEMPAVLAHLCGFIRPGGSIVIADFKPPTESAGLIDRAARSLYYRPVNLAGRVLGICALHPIYDYAPLLTEQELTIQSRTAIHALPGLAGYEVIVARRD